MAKKRSGKNCYQSPHSPTGYVHAAQYIVELICAKKAKVDGKELPIRFWELEDKKWLKYYKYQMMLVSQMMKKYSEYAIIAALRDKRTWKTFSLRSPFLVKIVEEYVKKEELARKIAAEVEYDFSKKETFASNNNKKSIISKLKDLDG
jgi:hypothetical protein